MPSNPIDNPLLSNLHPAWNHTLNVKLASSGPTTPYPLLPPLKRNHRGLLRLEGVQPRVAEAFTRQRNLGQISPIGIEVKLLLDGKIKAIFVPGAVRLRCCKHLHLVLKPTAQLVLFAL